MIAQLIEELKSELKSHLQLCLSALELAESEHCELRREENPPWVQLCRSRKKVLADLGESLQRIRSARIKWSGLDPMVRKDHRDIAELIRDNQNAIMKVIVLDRENEQLFLRRGLVPAGAIPSVARQRPHFVADLYRRHDTRC